MDEPTRFTRSKRVPPQPTDPTLAAVAAMETLDAMRRHAAGCTQCRVGPKFCNTRQEYERSFEKDYDNWQRLRALARG